MLRELRVRNYALIDELTLELDPALNVLTGETGAGKSIIIGALSALLGEKVDYETIRQGAEAALIEGRFQVADPALTALLADAGIPREDDELIIRRRIERKARAASYVNDQSVSQATLKSLGDVLVDIHGQHEHQSLLRVDLHRETLDRFGRLEEPRRVLARAFHDYHEREQELAALEADVAARRARRELVEFQVQEIEQAGLAPDEFDTLKQEKSLLESAEKRRALVAALTALLSEQEGSLLALADRVVRGLAELRALDPTLAVDPAPLTAAVGQFDELWRALVGYGDRIEFAPERLEQVNERLFFLERLVKKYGTDLAGIIAYGAQARTELASIEIDEERLARLRAERGAALDALRTQAEEVGRRRRAVKQQLEANAVTELAALGMDKARFVVEVQPDLDDAGIGRWEGRPCRLAEHGLDRVEFLFSANPGEEPRPLRKIASGGELSRIMLALKSILVEADRVPTMVFDEVDVGIGGRVAEAVGRKLAAIAGRRQVVCITHLPQIAKYAGHHFLVAKETRAGRTTTAIRHLTGRARVTEVARMLAGATITETTLRHAAEMLEEGRGPARS